MAHKPNSYQNTVLLITTIREKLLHLYSCLSYKASQKGTCHEEQLEDILLAEAKEAEALHKQKEEEEAKK